jgi:hypothetical protein
MRALKVLVVVLGVLLVAGFAVVVVTIMSRMGQRATPVSAAARAAPFGNTSVMLPENALVMEVQGAGDRILLRLDLADGTEMLLVLDAATGTELGRIKLDHEKAP